MKSIFYIFSVTLIAIGAYADVAVVRENNRIFLQATPAEISNEVGGLIQYKNKIDRANVPQPRIASSKFDITDLLRNEMKNIDARHWLDGTGGFGNCHGEAAYFSGLAPILAHDEAATLIDYSVRSSYWFDEGAPEICSDVEYADLQPGDIGRILDPSEHGVNIHSFTVISKNLVFSKNGHHGLKVPYQVRPLTEVADTYFSFNISEEENSELINYYRAGLAEGLDCLRGDHATKIRCVEKEYPTARFSRCKSIAEMEQIHSAALSADYFRAKQTIWNEVRALGANPNRMLSPQAFSAAYIQAAASVRQQVETDQGAIKNFFWNHLSALLNVTDDYMNPANEVRRTIFP